MLARIRERLSDHLTWLGLLLGLVATPGCAYESTYVAPNDGRARAVWKNDNVVVDLAGAPATDFCLEQLRAWSESGRLRLSTGDVKREAPTPARVRMAPSVGFWVPIYFGTALVARGPGLVPILPQPVLFSPSLALAGAVAHSTGGGATMGGGGSSGSGGDFGKLALVLAVVALVVLPIVDLAVAVATPENDRSTDAIDQVNVLNDLARTPGSPCAYGSAQ
jgi:hypothetical protein